MKSSRVTLMISVGFLVVSSCGPSQADLGTSVAETKAILDSSATAAASTESARLATETFQAAVDAESAHQAATATRFAETTATKAAEKTATKEATMAIATSNASSMHNQILELRAEGYLDQVTGTYYALPDFEQSWAQIAWYQWWPTGYSPTDFVIRANAVSDTDHRRADFSGCSFVFRETDESNHYMVTFGVGGWAELFRMYKGQGKRFFGLGWDTESWTRGSEVQIMLVVVDDVIQMFSNGELGKSIKDRYHTEGNLSLSVLSGTNRGYGTNCRMTNIELWILD